MVTELCRRAIPWMPRIFGMGLTLVPRSDPENSSPHPVARSGNNLKTITRHLHKATGRPFLSDATRGERDRMFAAAATAWLIMSAGNPNQALESLLDIKQGDAVVLSAGVLAVIAYFWCTFLIGSWTDLVRWGGDFGDTLLASLDGSSEDEAAALVAEVLQKRNNYEAFRSMRFEGTGQDAVQECEQPGQQFRREEAIRRLEDVRNAWWRYVKTAGAFFILIPAGVGVVTIVQMISFLAKLD